VIDADAAAPMRRLFGLRVDQRPSAWWLPHCRSHPPERPRPAFL